jgi:hypothetical protein
MSTNTNSLYGKNFIKMLKSSGYKSSIYAMAEIVDNSVDAGATNIDIIFIQNEVIHGQRTRTKIEKIVFIDNGKGMNEEILNGCLTFSEGAGRTHDRIGAFGVGLPNSSISVGNRVDIYSRTENSNWNYVFLDVNDQSGRDEAVYDKAKNKIPNSAEIGFNKELLDKAKTIVVWSEFDRLDAAKADTLITRGEKLLGRIYRYKIQNDLKIRFQVFNYKNSKPTNIIDILPNDPLFLMTSKNYITDILWEASKNEKSKHTELGHLEEFTAKYHYKKFVTGCIENQTSLPLFQKLDSFYNVEKEITLNGVEYKWRIKASFAYKSIANPGLRSGGRTKLGTEFGKKMSGDQHIKSANIFFLRANREIDFGSYGLYTVTDEKNRFWTIEIHFDSDLDELMGISNTKQSVDFKFVDSSQLGQYDDDDVLPIGELKSRLWNQMSLTIVRAITEMRKHLRDYSNEFKQNEIFELNKIMSDTGSGKMPTPEDPIIDIYTRGSEWSEEEIDTVSTFLQGKFMTIPKEDIRNQVESFSKGQSKTFVLYSASESGKLFEQTEIRGKSITLINTKHQYYTSIIEPLKFNPNLKVFTISIELLLSVLALEIDELKHEDPDRNEGPLDDLIEKLSYKLNKFIRDKHFEIKAEEYVNKNETNVEDEDDVYGVDTVTLSDTLN